MTNELAVRRLDESQIDLVKNTITKGSTDDELALFIEQCNRTGLDPFNRQIYAVKRWDGRAGREVMQTQISIDGARLVAQRSGEYAGQTEVFYCGSDRKWTDLWLGEDGEPMAAKVGVCRRGFVEPLWATATWEQYAVYTGAANNRKLSSMWAKMPALMLGKCAEMLALRKAFPMELSGLYSTEEMGQANSGTPGRATAPTTSVAPTNTVVPVEETGEVATDDQLYALTTSISLLPEADKLRLKVLWREANLPSLNHGLTSLQAERAIQLVMDILNAVADDVVDADVVDAEVVVEPSAADAYVSTNENDKEVSTSLATAPQVRAIQTLFGKLEIGGLAKHDRVAEIIGRSIESVKSLEKFEASQVIDQLQTDIATKGIAW